MNVSIKFKRIIMSVLGVALCGISVGFFRFSAFGVDPFQSFMSGTEFLSGIKIGVLNVIVNGVLILFSLAFDRRKIGIATVINMTLLGFIAQFSEDTLKLLLDENAFLIRCAFFVIGFVSLCFSSALYMTADLGVSTYDAVAIVMSEKWKWGKFKFVRICTDFVCVTLGIILFLVGGGEWTRIPTIVGVGTILTAFFMGPLIDLFNRVAARPMLYGKSERK